MHPSQRDRNAQVNPYSVDVSTPSFDPLRSSSVSSHMVYLRKRSSDGSDEERDEEEEEGEEEVEGACRTPPPSANGWMMCQFGLVETVANRMEGEKCANALIEQGITATNEMSGDNADPNKTDWTPLKGKHVIIWPDNDEPGKKYAEKSAMKLTCLGVEELCILEIPKDKPKGWDAADCVKEVAGLMGLQNLAGLQNLHSQSNTPQHQSSQLLNTPLNLSINATVERRVGEACALFKPCFFKMTGHVCVIFNWDVLE
ncbi:hypothetical protein LSTR_LSTR013767 [Laodelphax striatellus]|uniref:Toprim domain-containing protein n=1 Tax=Laodelphax striatellus TaxID=195883 RepID=A0A482WH53_LAOST|nr:hypothetical protein LSTR_LSTR013767 [Laodelphax striatellus]